MPTETKISIVQELSKLIEGSTIAISADYTNMSVGDMTDMRRALREKNVEFRVVKNSLLYLAAEAAGKPLMRDIVEGPTGIAFGYADPVEPAKALNDFVQATRVPLKIMGGVMGDRSLSAEEVATLATLPSKSELIARLLGQLQSPISGLAYVLNAPISSLARVLQRRSESIASSGE